ncbi:unnamed protein product [Prorocentrum cordatum]|uniref:Poly [ADP-ribose] polymerase n=1 Tax=Prorocentrum cordatum TaxID=2364126 RepID=A0ABN9YIQ1_9DINO|nr:unnamed protein product [Polarella glacialis]
MLLCRATLGRHLYTAELQPDPRRCEDACLRGTFREFVVFDEDQVYPSYIVRYKRVLPAPTGRG